MKEKVRDLMKAPIVTADWSIDLMSARRILQDNKINFLPVLDDHNRYYGIVSAWDLLQDLPPNTQLRQISRKDPITISQDESCHRAALVMLSQRVHHLLVVDPHQQRKLVGVLSSFDLLEYFI